MTTSTSSSMADPHEHQGHPPIAEHGLIGNLRTAALVAADGTVDWLCWPRFDSPSVFGAVLDTERGGHWRVAPVEGDVTTRQLYLPDTNMLITRFLSEDGVLELMDFMPMRADDRPQALVRWVRCVRGRMRVGVRFEPRPGYGTRPAEVDVREGGTVVSWGTGADEAMVLRTATSLTSTGTGASGDVTLSRGDNASFVLEWGQPTGEVAPVPEADAHAELNATTAYWRQWLSRSRYRGRWQEAVHRSALTLKLLTYEPTGAVVAAATTSLPEQVGGGRNWDYRYTWIRDASFSLYALLRLGFADEAAAFMTWLNERVADHDGESGPLHLMYAVDGSDVPAEQQLDHLRGYRGSGPVRIGNDAAGQLQLDIYGELVDSIYLFNKYARPVHHRTWTNLSRIVEWVCDNWDQPDEGIWETRDGRRPFTYSRVMSWVAIERAMRLARQRGLPADLVRWGDARDRIYRQVMDKGWHVDRRAFVQHYDTDTLDASVLLMPLVKFVAPTDPMWLSTLDAIGEDLVSDSLVFRYDPARCPDGLDGAEGTFSACSFWYVEALTRAGRVEEARFAFEKMLTYANGVGLYAEQISAAGAQLGNFPQALTHLALISAADNLDAAIDGR